MLLGIVSDIHCNAEGLANAIAAMNSVGRLDRLVCLGDCIYDYRFSNEVVALLRDHDAAVIQGNHEETFYSPAGVRARAVPWIDPGHFEWLAARPHQMMIEAAGRKVLAVHSTPWEPRGTYVHPKSRELERFGTAPADVVLYGHTHVQVVKQIGSVLVINPGSAGEARDPGNGRRLSCAVLDVASCSAQIIDY